MKDTIPSKQPVRRSWIMYIYRQRAVTWQLVNSLDYFQCYKQCPSDVRHSVREFAKTITRAVNYSPSMGADSYIGLIIAVYIYIHIYTYIFMVLLVNLNAVNKSKGCNNLLLAVHGWSSSSKVYSRVNLLHSLHLAALATARRRHFWEVPMRHMTNCIRAVINWRLWNSSLDFPSGLQL